MCAPLLLPRGFFLSPAAAGSLSHCLWSPRAAALGHPALRNPLRGLTTRNAVTFLTQAVGLGFASPPRWG